jgi:hypothetical protein
LAVPISRESCYSVETFHSTALLDQLLDLVQMRPDHAFVGSQIYSLLPFVVYPTLVRVVAGITASCCLVSAEARPQGWDPRESSRSRVEDSVLVPKGYHGSLCLSHTTGHAPVTAVTRRYSSQGNPRCLPADSTYRRCRFEGIDCLPSKCSLTCLTSELLDHIIATRHAGS